MSRSTFYIIVLSVILLLLTLPRFNRGDTIIKSISSIKTGEAAGAIDEQQYADMVLFFRGEQPLHKLVPPFTYRPLVSYIASYLPFKPSTAINILNIASLIGALLLLFKILTVLKLEFPSKILSCFLFVISFPTFYYSSIGFIDPVLIFFITAGLLFLFEGKFLLFVPVVAVGIFVKESIIMLIPLAMIYIYYSTKLLSTRILVVSSLFILSAIGYYLSRRIIPVDPTIGWAPSLSNFLMNVSRLRTYGSFCLTFGIPGILSLLLIFYKRDEVNDQIRKEYMVLLYGLIISVCLFIYALLAAYADGRFIWTSYPFTIPLSAIFLNNILRGRQIKI